MFNWYAAVIAGLFSLYGIFWQAAVANSNNMLTLFQMRHYRQVWRGLPFANHGGMLGDIIIITPVVMYVVGSLWDTWAWWQIISALVVGCAASYGMHETYKGAPWPEAHVEGGRLTAVGCIHLGYMAGAFAALLLYYVRPVAQGELPIVAAVSTALVVHVIFGTHVPIGIGKMIDPTGFGYYPGDPLRSMGTWGAVGGTTLLVGGRTAWLAYAGY